MREILRGKRFLLTGATGGLGRELAREFASCGAALFVTARDPGRLNALADELLGYGASLYSEAVDLALADGVDSLVKAVRSRFDTVDVLVNCAGVFPVAEVGEISVEDLDQCLAVNLRAPLLLARAFAPGMVRQRWGRVINIGSSSSYSGFRRTTAYCASKHGLLGLSRALHDELKEHNVRSICVSPGSIQTEMGHKVLHQDFSTFLDPRQVACFVVDLACVDGSMSVEEIRLNRTVMR